MIDIFFITSSKAKLEHAKFICRDYNVQILKQKQYGIGYLEPRIKDREKLLAESINDAVKRLRKVVSNLDEKFIIIEDTSVIIESLSSDLEELPGVDVKYWMQDMTFEKIDYILKKNGNNRNVTVRSDLILFLPKILQEKFKIKYKHFIGLSNGIISTQNYNFSTQPLYPWLSSQTFNKWFVPEGEKLPISLLDISQANKKDFRMPAFAEMLFFLKENGLIKNRKPGQSYKQMNLFNLSLFIICGRSCSGKTTLSEYLTRKFGVYHIEASDFMYLSYYERHGPNSDVLIGNFAKKALLENPAIVVDQIITHLNKLKKGNLLPIVISGFRDPSEIRIFKQKYSGALDISEVFIEAKDKLRFQRCLLRGRSDSSMTLKDFRKKDKQQDEMGLKVIEEKINFENVIKNEHSFENYYLSFEMRFYENLFSLTRKKDVHDIKYNLLNSPKALEDAILIALADKRNEHLTTTQIAHLINSKFKFETHKGKDNVSRYFNYKYYPYYELKVENEKIMYKLSQTGFSFSQLLMQKLNQA